MRCKWMPISSSRLYFSFKIIGLTFKRSMILMLVYYWDDDHDAHLLSKVQPLQRPSQWKVSIWKKSILCFDPQFCGDVKDEGPRMIRYLWQSNDKTICPTRRRRSVHCGKVEILNFDDVLICNSRTQKKKVNFNLQWRLKRNWQKIADEKRHH